MKIRNGFVSNSSSSSFIIISDKKIDESSSFVDLFSIPKESPFYKLSCDIASTLFNNSNLMSYSDLVEEYFWCEEEIKKANEDIEFAFEELQDIFKSIEELKKFKEDKLYLRYGSNSDDDGDPIESMLRYYDLDIESDGIKITNL